MFTGLDDIDRELLRHAYGSAQDVPRWVRGLIDSDRDLPSGRSPRSTEFPQLPPA